MFNYSLIKAYQPKVDLVNEETFSTIDSIVAPLKGFLRPTFV